MQVNVVSSSGAGELAPKRLQYDGGDHDHEDDEVDNHQEGYTYTYVSPLEREIQKAEQAVNEQQIELDHKTAMYMDYFEKFPSPSGDTSKTLCGKCHFRSGHSKQHCKSHEVCVSAQVCGQMKFHPDEKSELSKKAKEKSEAESKLKELQENLKTILDRVDRLNNSFERVMMTPLVRSDTRKYLKEINGKFYEKWNIINQDMEIVRNALHNKVPSDIDSIDICEIMSSRKGLVLRREDAVRKRMRDEGITFPPNKKRPEKKNASSPDTTENEPSPTTTQPKIVVSPNLTPQMLSPYNYLPQPMTYWHQPSELTHILPIHSSPPAHVTQTGFQMASPLLQAAPSIGQTGLPILSGASPMTSPLAPVVASTATSPFMSNATPYLQMAPPLLPKTPVTKRPWE